MVISQTSSLKILAPPHVRLVIESLDLDGALVIDCSSLTSTGTSGGGGGDCCGGGGGGGGGRGEQVVVVVKDLAVANKGVELVPLTATELSSPEVSPLSQVLAVK